MDITYTDAPVAPFVQAAPAVTHVPAVSGEDRRRSDRVAQRVPGWISGESHDRAARGRDVFVSDLSMHGVGFHSPRVPFRIGAQHWLVVNGVAMRVSTRVKIVSCRPAEAGGYTIGAMFF